MPPYPDDALPQATLSLAEFNGHARRILNSNSRHRVEDFMAFVLAGRIDTPEGTARVELDPFSDANDDGHNWSFTRDFDSLLGTSTDLPFRVPISIYPIPSFRDTLSKGVHFRGPIRLDVGPNLV